MQPMVILGLVAALLGLSPVAVAAPGDALRVRPVEIIDHNGFERPIPALRILVPHDWQTEGGVVWDTTSGCTDAARRFEWAAWSPDGLFGIELMPNTVWTMSNLPPQYQSMDPCPKRQAFSVRQYLEQLVQERRPGARPLDYRDRPDMVAEMGIPAQHTPMPMGEMRQWVEAGEILIGYSYQGVQRREVIQAVVIFMHTVMQDGMGGQPMEFLNAIAMPAFAVRAPDGRLDFAMGEALRASMRADPAYEQRMARHYQQMASINAKGVRDRSNTVAQTNAETMDIITKGWEERQRMRDEGAERFSRVIRDVDLYSDPVQGNVELPSHYERAWRLDNGDYLLSNDHHLEPWRDLGLGGTEMERLP